LELINHQPSCQGLLNYLSESNQPPQSIQHQQGENSCWMAGSPRRPIETAKLNLNYQTNPRKTDQTNPRKTYQTNPRKTKIPRQEVEQQR